MIPDEISFRLTKNENYLFTISENMGDIAGGSWRDRRKDSGFLQSKQVVEASMQCQRNSKQKPFRQNVWRFDVQSFELEGMFFTS